jgi:Golgi casein kinase, C-terminal, Fam20
VPPIVGRKLNITSEMLPIVDGDLIDNFYVSPANNICFFADVDYYSDTMHPVCGDPHMTEGSFSVLIDYEMGKRWVRGGLRANKGEI